MLTGKIKSKTNHLNTQRVDAYIFKRKKKFTFSKVSGCVWTRPVTRSVFSRKLSLLQRLLGLLIETGKQTNKQTNDPRNNLISGHLSATVSFSVLRFALASAVNTRIH